jgi:hypothetical protein
VHGWVAVFFVALIFGACLGSTDWIAPGRAITVPPLLFGKLAAEDIARIGVRDDDRVPGRS